jgi:KipI family sensor histidine kinase inhibitor
LLPLGDTGVLAEYAGEEISDAANDAVRALWHAVRQRPPAGFIEAVPAYRSLLVIYDPERADAAEVCAAVSAACAQADPLALPPGRLVEIPASYGGTHGPDLAAVAVEVGLSESEVISLHSGQEYRVYMLGFTPGYPYMGTLPPRLRVGRLASPRTHVPERSVAIAGQQTGIYPVASPGGWRLIGRTPLRIYDPGRASPFLLDAGDRVRFVPISAAEYAREAPQDAPPAPVPAPSRPDLVVEEGGLLTTVQDLGRPGYRRFGLPQGGGMDSLSLRITNLLLGNIAGAAVLEFTSPGPRLVAGRRTVVALGGADHSPSVNGRPAPMWSAFELREGDVLAFGTPRSGQWGYLAVPGGFAVPEVLGSRATYARGGLGGYGGRALGDGDRLSASRRAPTVRLALPPGRLPPVGGASSLRMVIGPQDDYFTEESLAMLCREEYRISTEIDRLGYRLLGPRLSHRAKTEMLSDGLLPGAVQVPAGGQLIVIMPDGPTSGGYPKIGAVLRPDLRLLAQARRNDVIRFQAVSWERAHEAAREEAAYMASLRFLSA